MPELFGLSKHLVQPVSLSGIKASSPQAGFVLLWAEEQAERRAPPGFLPPSPWTWREQRDLQGKDPNYKVLMIRITCVQVWTSVPKSGGFRRRKRCWKEPGAGGQGPRAPGSASPKAEHSRFGHVSSRKDAQPPWVLRGLAGSRNQEVPPDGPGPLLRSTGKLLFSLSVQAAAKGLLRTEYGLRKETCLAWIRTTSRVCWNIDH